MPGARTQKEDVLEAARRVLEDAGSVVSLTRMHGLVQRRLKQQNDGWTVSPARLRVLLAAARFCRMEIRTRQGDRSRRLSRCPVCRGQLAPVRNQTLFGGEVTVTLQCRRCPYFTGKAKRVPVLYVFHWEGAPRRAAAELAQPEKPSINVRQ